MILNARDKGGADPVVAKLVPAGPMILAGRFSARDKGDPDPVVTKVVPEGPMILAGRFSARDKSRGSLVAKRRFIPETVRTGFTVCVEAMAAGKRIEPSLRHAERRFLLPGLNTTVLRPRVRGEGWT